jgi:hypothetical protein
MQQGTVYESLSAISVEARKKYPKVKEAAERGILMGHNNSR